MIPEETNYCDECKCDLVPEVLQSAAGYYIGTRCQCGPYSRDSGYYPNREAAQDNLNIGTYTR